MPTIEHACHLIISSQSAGDYARLYKEYDLQGGHVIKLGPRNEEAAREALAAWPGVSLDLDGLTARFISISGGLQIGGGITAVNAQEWLDAGASKVGTMARTDFRLNPFRSLSLPISSPVRNFRERDLMLSPKPSAGTGSSWT